MTQKHAMERPKDRSRRKFLQTVGAGVPTLSLFAESATSPGGGQPPKTSQLASTKFTPIDISGAFNCSPKEYGPQEQAKGMSGLTGKDGLIRTPAGRQAFQGIPFLLGPDGLASKRWLALSNRPRQCFRRTIDIPVRKKATFLCVAAFCDWDPNESVPSSDPDVVMERVGQRLAEAVLVFADGKEKVLPVRRRFEVAPPNALPHAPFVAISHIKDTPVSFADPLRDSEEWGNIQQAVIGQEYPRGTDHRMLPVVWVSALANPEPARLIETIRLNAAADDALLVCGLTLFHGGHHPLRLSRLSLYRLTLPESTTEDSKRWQVNVDLGVVARTYVLEDFSSESWLSSPRKGLGKRNPPVRGAKHLFVEMTCAPDATLSLHDAKTGQRYLFEINQVVPGREVEGKPGGTRVEILEPEKVWVHGSVADTTTGRPTPVRLAFRSKEGRYIPPYGHRTEVNDAWFEDYGADLKLEDTPFAYVDGTFQIELPVGEVYLEMTKGFEYEAVRRRVTIDAHQSELRLEISRFDDLRSQGWTTADVHVHFLPPTTAVLEAQAEGVNIVNLLAAQWGDLFTNVGDFSENPLTSRDGETIIQVGTENRQHILGHLGLLGGNGAPIYPLSAGGPAESYLGDPVWVSAAEWADACRKRGGLVLSPHFPYPTGEQAADIALGKFDCLGIQPRFKGRFHSLRFQDWYRYLNCGYRLPAAGGTDKMGAYMPVGANRTYAYLGQEEFNFANWAKAVRSGKTFVSSGPLLILKVDGHMPGDEIMMHPGGGTVEVRCQARCHVPIHAMEIVLNGRVVASREIPQGTQEITLNEKIQVPGPAWLVARAISNLDPTTSWSLNIAAHTSPVYFRVRGEELFSAATIDYMLTLIEGSQRWVEELATRPDPERFEKVRKVFLDAREILHQRLHQHGIRH